MRSPDELKPLCQISEKTTASSTDESTRSDIHSERHSLEVTFTRSDGAKTCLPSSSESATSNRGLRKCSFRIFDRKVPFAPKNKAETSCSESGERKLDYAQSLQCPRRRISVTCRSFFRAVLFLLVSSMSCRHDTSPQSTQTKCGC